jgi:hydrogenase maturation protease
MGDSWRKELAARIVEPVAVVGIGNVDSGDDALGPEVVRLLSGRTRAALFDCGTVPENFIGPIAQAKPACVILIDAVGAGGSPGDVVVLDAEALLESGLQTHAPSPALFLNVLAARTGAKCFAIGVTPGATGFGLPLSPEVATAAREVADEIARLLPADEKS